MGNAATNKSGVSTKHPTMGMTWKRALKLEKIARLSADPAGYSTEQIANLLNCTPQTVILIRQTPQYHAKMLEVSTGVTSTYDENLRTNTENAKQELEQMVPMALLTIRNAILDPKTPTALKLKASAEILDRDGKLAKVSKSSVEHVTKPSIGVDPTVAANLAALMGGAPLVSPGALPGTNVANAFTTSAANAVDADKQMFVQNEAIEKLLDEIKVDPNKVN